SSVRAVASAMRPSLSASRHCSAVCPGGSVPACAACMQSNRLRATALATPAPLFARALMHERCSAVCAAAFAGAGSARRIASAAARTGAPVITPYATLLLVSEIPPIPVTILLQDVLRDEDFVDLVWPVGDAQRPCGLVHLRQRKVARHAGAAPDLDRAVDDAMVRSRHEDLDRRDVGARVAAVFHLLGAMQRHQARGLDVDVAVGDEALHELLRFELAAVDLAHHRALDHEVECAPHLADRIHAVVDAPGAEAILRGLVAGAGAAERVAERHADVVVID